MTIYHTYLSDSTESGLETIQGIQNDGSEFGVGISSDIVCNNLNATGIITATQINGTIVGFSTLSVAYADSAGIATYATTAGIATYATTAGIATYATTAGIATYATTAGIATYATTAGISTTSQGLTGTPNITVGIVTAAAYVATGTTAVYAGINTSTVDTNTTAFHYVTFDTTNSAVNISNFTSGKKFEIVARNSSGGNRNLIIRTSTTTTGHAAAPQIVHAAGTITNGTISIGSGVGLLISVYNMGGTIVGVY